MSSRELLLVSVDVVVEAVFLVAALQLLVSHGSRYWAWRGNEGRWRRSLPLLMWVPAWFLIAFGCYPVVLLLARTGLHDLVLIVAWMLAPILLMLIWHVCTVGAIRRQVDVIDSAQYFDGYRADGATTFRWAIRVVRRRTYIVAATFVLLAVVVTVVAGSLVGRQPSEWRPFMILLASVVGAFGLRGLLEVVDRVDPLATFLAHLSRRSGTRGRSARIDRWLSAPWDGPHPDGAERRWLLACVPVAALALRRVRSLHPPVVAEMCRDSADELVRRFTQALASGENYRNEWIEVRSRILRGEFGRAPLRPNWRPPGVWSLSELSEGRVARLVALVITLATAGVSIMRAIADVGVS